MAWTPVNPPPPGWYPDPGGSAAQRWWDGRTWTAQLWPLQAGPGAWPAQGGPGAWPAQAGRTTPPAQGGPIARPPQGGRRLPARAAWWGLAGVAAGVVLSVLFQGIAYAIAPRSDALIVLFGEIGLWTALAGTCVLASRRYGTGRLDQDFGLSFRSSDAVLGMAGFVVCVFVAAIVGGLFAHTSFRGSNTGIIKRQAGDNVGVAIVAAIAAIGAPIFEELFFRGFLRLSLQSRIGWTGAVWAQAACFGLAHFQPGLGLGAVSVIAGTMSIGVVLGYLAHITGRLGAGMVAHGMFNLFVTLIVLTTK